MRRRPFSRSGRRVFRKLAGVILAAAGVALLLRMMPGWFWVICLGAGMIWGGWAFFALED